MLWWARPRGAPAARAASSSRSAWGRSFMRRPASAFAPGLAATEYRAPRRRPSEVVGGWLHQPPLSQVHGHRIVRRLGNGAIARRVILDAQLRRRHEQAQVAVVQAIVAFENNLVCAGACCL